MRLHQCRRGDQRGRMEFEMDSTYCLRFRSMTGFFLKKGISTFPSVLIENEDIKMFRESSGASKADHIRDFLTGMVRLGDAGQIGGHSRLAPRPIIAAARLEPQQRSVINKSNRFLPFFL